MINVQNTIKFNFYPWIKYALHWTIFHETEAWPTAFSKCLLYRIRWKSEEQFDRWYWVMGKLYGYGLYIYMSHSFLLHKECLKSDLHACIQVTLFLLIIFVGLSVKYITSNFCCFPSCSWHIWCFPAIVVFLHLLFFSKGPLGTNRWRFHCVYSFAGDGYFS